LHLQNHWRWQQHVLHEPRKSGSHEATAAATATAAAAATTAAATQGANGGN